jgi:hypothetical protein
MDSERTRNDWNARHQPSVLMLREIEERVMYIGLGGLLILILVLWLLGII